MRVFLVSLAALAIIALPAAAQGNEPLAFSLQSGSLGHHTAQPVDYLTWCGDCVNTNYMTGTPWVINPRDSWPYSLPPADFEPGCLWDSDDYFSYWSHGSTMAAGATAGITECRYASEQPYAMLGVFVSSPSPDLRITERWTWAGGSVSTSTQGVYDAAGRLWRYTDCIASPRASAPLLQIPNSHGGYALPQLMSVTVTNSGRKVGKTSGIISTDYSHGEIQSLGCLSFRDP